MFSRLLSIALLAAACSLPAATLSFVGALSTSDPVYNRPVSTGALSGAATAVFYDFYTFTVHSSGFVRLEIMPGAAAPALADSFISLYRAPFIPLNPLFNILAVDDDSGADRLSRLNENLTPSNYIVVVTSFGNLQTGNYHLQMEGDVTAEGAVPEPSTVLLSLAGLAAIATWKRRS